MYNGGQEPSNRIYAKSRLCLLYLEKKLYSFSAYLFPATLFIMEARNIMGLASGAFAFQIDNYSNIKHEVI